MEVYPRTYGTLFLGTMFTSGFSGIAAVWDYMVTNVGKAQYADYIPHTLNRDFLRSTSTKRSLLLFDGLVKCCPYLVVLALGRLGRCDCRIIYGSQNYSVSNAASASDVDQIFDKMFMGNSVRRGNDQIELFRDQFRVLAVLNGPCPIIGADVLTAVVLLLLLKKSKASSLRINITSLLVARDAYL
ncbi:hypothetical protein BDZ97DRAFT_1753098 [Flammula alnicola]|nr:hypothetical protein BDZ97DRAFT_1753098 [Flammula alnicola]